MSAARGKIQRIARLMCALVCARGYMSLGKGRHADAAGTFSAHFRNTMQRLVLAARQTSRVQTAPLRGLRTVASLRLATGGAGMALRSREGRSSTRSAAKLGCAGDASAERIDLFCCSPDMGHNCMSAHFASWR